MEAPGKRNILEKKVQSSPKPSTSTSVKLPVPTQPCAVPSKRARQVPEWHHIALSKDETDATGNICRKSESATSKMWMLQCNTCKVHTHLKCVGMTLKALRKTATFKCKACI